MNPQPQILSNEIEEFQAGGGLYPGGTCIVEEACYKLHDYNGTRPKDSVCSAYLRLKPIDGSNDGKIVEQFYSIGGGNKTNVDDFMPDNTGGNIISMKGTPFRDSSNWAHFLETARNNCGLEKGKLSGPTGIRILQNAVITVIKADQKHHDFGDELPMTGRPDDRKKQKRTTLLPTKLALVGDPNYANATRNMPAPPQPGQAPMPVQTQAQAHTQAPVNGSPAPTTNTPPMTQGTAAITDLSLSGVLKYLLAKNSGSLTTVGLPKLVLEELIGANIDRVARVNLAKEAGDVNALTAAAQANGWVLAGTDLIG